MGKHTMKDLYELQALPLYLKVRLTKQRIREWISHYGEDGVYVSFSGGKDSTVLLRLVREEFAAVPAVFIAEMWTAYTGTKITPLDVAMMMCLLKIARIKNGGGSGDSFVDLAGYAACGGEIHECTT